MELITRDKVRDWIPVRAEDTYKNRLGHVLCIGGDDEKGGAIILAATACVYSGAGLVTVATDKVNRSALHARLPEAMFVDRSDRSRVTELIQQVDVILIGPGLGVTDAASELLHHVLGHVTAEQIVVLDADALTIVSQHRHWLAAAVARLIYTPHVGEWRRLSDQAMAAHELSHDELLTFAHQLKGTLVLKGAPTQVVTQTICYRNTTGNPSQAIGGMGDTLAGMIASFVAQSPSEQIDAATLSAVYLHSAIADELAQTHYVTLPTMISQRLPLAMRQLITEKEK